MRKPMIRIHNIELYEIIDRQMTDVEFDKYQTEQAEFAAAQIEAEQKATAKAALLDRLGITADEAKLLLS